MLRACLFVVVALPWAIHAEESNPTVRWNPTTGCVEITGLKLTDAKNASEVVSVFVDRGNKPDQLAMLGKFRLAKQTVIFEPRFPLVRGVRYRVVVKSSNDKPFEAIVSIPKPKSKPTTVVTQVYPTTNKLPENQLKFYLHFSSPMSQGDSYKYLSLLDAKGKKIDLPFLELDEELWDPTGTRFTLFFDPGRIKRGLKPREEVGPALEEGKSYTLVIDRRWHDAEGNPLKATFKKAFSVGPPDDEQPDVRNWKIVAPRSGSRDPLRVTIPESLDHALANRLIWVVDKSGKKVVGNVELSQRETVWTFVPKTTWSAGIHHLVADTRLEDLAGNSLGRPFEIDVLRPIERRIKTKTVNVAFTVK